jgi:hypothetical protein
MDANWQYEDRNKHSIFLFQFSEQLGYCFQLSYTNGFCETVVNIPHFVAEQINLQGRLHLENSFQNSSHCKTIPPDVIQTTDKSVCCLHQLRNLIGSKGLLMCV